MKISKAVKVGFVAIFAIAMSVWGINYLKGTNLFVKSKSVYAIYPKVPGLSVSSPIIINGVQSGVVDDIYFHSDKSSRVIVKLNITESGLKIYKNSIAELISTDFMGGKAIGLKLGDSGVDIENGDTLQTFFEKSMLEDFSEQMLPIKENLESMMDSLGLAASEFKELARGLNNVLDKKRQNDIRLAISKLSSTLDGFNEISMILTKTVETKVNPALDSFSELADSLKTLELNKTLVKAQTAMDGMTSIMNKMNKGEGTMGKLLTNDSLYNNLTGATREMEELLEDIKLHPKRYFRILSKKEIPYKKD